MVARTGTPQIPTMKEYRNSLEDENEVKIHSITKTCRSIIKNSQTKTISLPIPEEYYYHFRPLFRAKGWSVEADGEAFIISIQ